MKRKITFFIAIALFMVSFTAKSQIDYDFEVDGIKYKKLTENPKTAKVADAAHYEFYPGYPALTTPNVEIPEVAQGYTVTEIGNLAFSKNTVLQSIKIPSTVTTIWASAFAECINLTQVDLSEATNLTTIEGMSFSKCTSLTEITIPNSVATIRYSAFAGCTNLATVNMGNSVTAIGPKAFLNCPITKITLPSTLVAIGFATFAQTNATEWGDLQANQVSPTTLTEVTAEMDNPVTDVSNGSSPDWRDFNNLAFGMTAVDNSKTLIVPAAYKHLYETNTPWSYFFASPSTDLKDTKVSNFLHFNSTNKTVTTSGVKGNMSVFDLSGKVVLSQKITEDKTTVNVHNLNKGIYIFKVGKNIQKLMIK